MARRPDFVFFYQVTPQPDMERDDIELLRLVVGELAEREERNTGEPPGGYLLFLCLHCFHTKGKNLVLTCRECEETVCKECASDGGVCPTCN